MKIPFQKITIACLMIGSVVVLGGCSVLNNKPRLYGNDSCKSDHKTAYVYSNGNAAICLNEKSVAYMVCARKLGISSENHNTHVQGGVSASKEQLSPELQIEGNNTVNISYAETGELALARAKAIQTCVDIYNTYPTVAVNGVTK